jgi:hypothetical protein
MTDKSKKRFLITTIIGSFVIYSIIYYAHVFKIAPYNFKEFKSFTIRYGTRGNMVNYYNSVTGDYNYLDKNDSLKKTNLRLTTADLDSLHRYAADLGFWDFPDYELNPDTTNPQYKNVPRYFIQYSYKRKTKKVLFDANFAGPDKLVDANRSLITKIRYILSNAEERQRK